MHNSRKVGWIIVFLSTIVFAEAPKPAPKLKPQPSEFNKKAKVNYYSYGEHMFKQTLPLTIEKIVELNAASNGGRVAIGWCARNLFPEVQDGAQVIFSGTDPSQAIIKTFGVHLRPLHEKDGKATPKFFEKRQNFSTQNHIAFWMKQPYPYSESFPLMAHNSSARTFQWLHYNTQTLFKSGDVDAERLDYDYYFRYHPQNHTLHVKQVTRRAMVDPGKDLPATVGYCEFKIQD